MTKSDQIRTLGAAGLKPAEIAKRLGIRYQHAYNVLKATYSDKGTTKAVSPNIGSDKALRGAVSKPSLTVEMLVAGGFVRIGRWILSGDNLAVENPVPKEVGVYAFAKAGIAQYVGVATMGLSKRLYFYGRPGITQRTSLRLNTIIKAELLGPDDIEIYAASPPDLEWNGLPIHGSAGLELGLIKRYKLLWNTRSADN